MSFIDNIFGKKIAVETQPAKELAVTPTVVKGAEPKTFVVGGASQSNRMFSPQQRNVENLRKYRVVYEQGGVARQAIDCYPLYAMMNSYSLVGGDDKQKEMVEDFLDRIDFEGKMWEAIIDALVSGDAYQEIIPTRGGGVFDLMPRDSTTFNIIHDDKGVILGYEQEVDMGAGQTRKVSLKPPEIFHLTLFKSGGKVYGDSIIKSSYDDIVRDAIVMEGAANAIKRHGYPKYQIKAGTEAHPASDADLDNVASQFVSIDSKNEWTTRHDVEIKMLDESGLTGLDTYHRISVQRLCSSLGVPGDLIGFREGTTDSTANSRIDSFFKKISTIQQKVARQFNKQVIDRITGEPGSVYIVFNPATQPSENDIVNMFSTLMKADSTDPWAVITRGQIYERLGWNLEEYEDNKEEQDKLDEVELPVETPTDPSASDTIVTENGNKVPSPEAAAKGRQDPAFIAQQEAAKAAAKAA